MSEEDYIGPNKKCALCGKRATGFAAINDDRYCHGDNDPEPTCYMKATWELSLVRFQLEEEGIDVP